MPLDTIRHIALFDPSKFKHPVTIIGCGATGSRIALEIAKLGVEDIIIYDDDTIESHNIANQAFIETCYPLEEGKYKAEVISNYIKKIRGNPAVVKLEKVVDQTLSGVVFLLTDTMASRKEIWEASIKMKFNVPLMIETRMDADSMRIYSVRPNNTDHIKHWESTLYEDDDAEESRCGGRTSIGATAEIISGMAVWEMLKWYGTGVAGGNEIIFALRPDPRLTLIKF